MKVNGYTGVALCACIVCLFTLAACNNKTDANEKNFRVALTKYLNTEKSDECLRSDVGGILGKWPVDVQEGAWFGVKTMAALESVGLVKSEDTVVDKMKVKRYTLTDAAKPFIREINGLGGEPLQQICWGKPVLDKVVKWNAPVKLGDYQETLVTYTYTISNIAEWAKSPAIQAAFGIKNAVDGASTVQKDRHIFHMTSQGWEAR